MAPWRASTTKSEWLPDNPTAFVPSRLWKSPFITTWDDSRNQNLPTDSAEEVILKAKTQVTHLAEIPLAKAEAESEGQEIEWELYRDTDGMYRWWLKNGVATV